MKKKVQLTALLAIASLLAFAFLSIEQSPCVTALPWLEGTCK